MDEVDFSVEDLGVQPGNLRHSIDRRLVHEQGEHFPVLVCDSLPLGWVTANREGFAAGVAPIARCASSGLAKSNVVVGRRFNGNPMLIASPIATGRCWRHVEIFEDAV